MCERRFDRAWILAFVLLIFVIICSFIAYKAFGQAPPWLESDTAVNPSWTPAANYPLLNIKAEQTAVFTVDAEGDVTFAGSMAASISGTNDTTFTIDQDNAGAGADTNLGFNRGSSGADATFGWTESDDFMNIPIGFGLRLGDQGTQNGALYLQGNGAALGGAILLWGGTSDTVNNWTMRASDTTIDITVSDAGDTALALTNTGAGDMGITTDGNVNFGGTVIAGGQVTATAGPVVAGDEDINQGVFTAKGDGGNNGGKTVWENGDGEDANNNAFQAEANALTLEFRGVSASNLVLELVNSGAGVMGLDSQGDVTIDQDLIVSTDTLFADASEGKVGIGVTDPAGELEVAMDAASASIRIGAWSSTGAHNGQLIFNSGAGTRAAPTPSASGDVIGTVEWRTTDINGDLDRAAQIRVVADTGINGSADTSDAHSYIVFQAAPDGGLGEEKMRLMGDGFLAMADESGAPAAIAGFSGIYSVAGELFSLDDSSNSNPLSPHSERIIDASGDPLDPSPYFLVSINFFTGTRVIMYQSNYMRYVSGLPVSSTQFIWYEQIPNRERRSPAAWRKRAKREVIRAYKDAIIEASPTIEIALAQATRYLEDTEVEEYSEYVTRWIVDPETGEKIERTRLVSKRRRIGLGTFSHKLRPGVTLDPDTGTLYRKRRIADVPTPATGTIEFPDLPQWVLDRLP